MLHELESSFLLESVRRMVELCITAKVKDILMCFEHKNLK